MYETKVMHFELNPNFLEPYTSKWDFCTFESNNEQQNKCKWYAFLVIKLIDQTFDLFVLLFSEEPKMFFF